LTITIDVGPAQIAAAKPSASGKTRIVAGTGGFVRLTDSLSLSVNLITK
jgi:hypothetical protein